MAVTYQFLSRIPIEMKNRIKYEFSAILWQQCWYFVSLPEEMSNEIRANLKFQEEGWGRMKAVAKIGHSQWETAIWFDTKRKTYLLPIKAEIRKKENIGIDSEIKVYLWI